MSRWVKLTILCALCALLPLTSAMGADLFSLLSATATPLPTETPAPAQDLFGLLMGAATPAPTATPAPAQDIFGLLLGATPAPTQSATETPAPTATPVPTPGTAVIKDVSAVRKSKEAGSAQSLSPIGESDRLVAENEKFALYLNESACTVKLEIKENGYVFSSVPDAEKLSSLNEEWRRVASSLAVVEYLNASGATSRVTALTDKSDKPEYEYTDNGFAARLHFGEAGIRLTIRFILTDDGFTVSVDRASIIEEGNVYLSRLQILPFFGAVCEDEMEGYILLPDGCGAMIDFAQAHNYIAAYSGRVYGADYGTKRVTGYQSIRDAGATDLNMPLFGMAHTGGGAAFLAVCEKGESYMTVDCAPSGVMTKFSRAGASFIFRESYNQPTGSATTFLAIPQEMNDIDVSLHYILLSGEDADYSGMARAYREKLIAEGTLKKLENAGEETPLLLRVLLSESEKSVLGVSGIVMTTISQAQSFAEKLTQAGVGRVDMSLSGYAPGGATRQRLGTQTISGSVGGQKALNSLRAAVSGEVYLEQGVIVGYESQTERGRLSYNVDGGLISLHAIDKPLEDTFYYQNLSFVRSALESASLPLALTDAGNTLQSDMRDNRTVTRAQTLSGIREALTECGVPLALHSPYAYAFSALGAAMETPMKNSQYAYESESVPFYQMVLSGCATMYSSALNYSASGITDALRLIDYGVCPAYIVTEKSASELKYTNTTDLYSSRFADWEGDMLDVYKTVEDALNAVRGQSILRRTSPMDGVVRLEYDGGTVLYVNYNDFEASADGLVLPALSATTKEAAR